MDGQRFKVILDQVPPTDREGDEIRSCIEEVQLLENEMDDVAELRRVATEVGPGDAKVFTTT
jgi:hypothetical protein